MLAPFAFLLNHFVATERHKIKMPDNHEDCPAFLFVDHTSTVVQIPRVFTLEFHCYGVRGILVPGSSNGENV